MGLNNLEMLNRGILAKAHTPPYKIHRYFARRPWNVFRQLINIFSNESDIVLDPFCGGGVTIYEGLNLGRRVIGLDLNPLSTFIVENMVKKGLNLSSLDKDMKLLTDFLEKLYTPHELIDYNDQPGILIYKKFADWYELAHIVFCNFCNTEIVLSNQNKLKDGRYVCSNEKCPGNKKNGGFVEPKNCKRNSYRYLFSVTIIPNTKKKIIKKIEDSDLERIENHLRFLKSKIKKNNIEIPHDEIPLDWDRQNEDLLKRKNINTFQELFTKRNLYINLLLLNKIKSIDTSKENYELLRFVFSKSIRDTNIMTFTNEGWQSGRPTTWAKHAYWIPSQFCELNVLYAFRKAFAAIERALKFNDNQPYIVKKANRFSRILEGKNFYLLNDSLDNSDIPDNGIDAIITDPPYGSNVQYLELSHFWHVWNKDLYPKKRLKFSKEAVTNRKKNFKGAKSYYEYEENLYHVFKRSFQVLKPNKYMVLTFNNKDMNAWLALLISIFRAGFSLEKDGLYFQEGIKNYKQTAHTKAEGSPYGDFIYVFRKSTTGPAVKGSVSQSELVDVINNTVGRQLQRYRQNEGNRDEIKKNIFLETIPFIERFVKTNYKSEKKHNLYDIYKKGFLGDFYKKVLVSEDG